MITDIKTKKRNRLSNETISAICTIRSTFQAENINCVSFQVDPRHLELHNSQNLYSEKNMIVIKFILFIFTHNICLFYV